MQTININAVPDGFPQVLYYSQGDIGRQFIINVTDFTIPSGATVKIQATKPSGLGFSVAGTVSSNAVTFTTTADMTDEAGRYPAELQITSGGNVIGTANFTMNGEPNPHPDGTTDGSIGTIIPELTLLVEEIRESNAKVETMTASAVPLASDSDPTASYDADDNNLEFGIPVPEVTESEFLKAFIVESASGDIASFTDGGDDVPMKSLVVNIEPKQSGSGDPSPSNIRSISGWDEVGVVRTGKNLLPYPYYDTTKTTNGITFTVNNDGSININGTATARVLFFIADKSVKVSPPSGSYVFSKSSTASGVTVILEAYNGNSWVKNLATSSTSDNTPFTLDYDGYDRIGCYISVNSGTSVNNALYKPMIRVASDTDGTYEPYEAETKSITLPSTVYGGTLDVVSGNGKSTMAIIDLGTVSWGKLQDGRFYVSSSQIASRIKKPQADELPNALCTAYKIVKYNVSWGANYNMFVQSNGTLYARNDAYTDASAFKSAMSGVMLCYELETPTDFTTEPTEITTLLGSNNIWSDAGTVEVTYRADTTLAYNKLLSLIANS